MLFLCLGKLSREGKKKIKEAPQRLQKAIETLKSLNAEVKGFYAMLGPYDYVAIVSAPDPLTAAKASALISSEGEVDWETYSIIPFEEFAKSLMK